MTGLLPAPSNDMTRLTGAFVSKISPSVDISHQLVGNFGGFLLEIPKRLGTNAALDAAADVLASAFARYCAGYRNADANILVKHSRSLSALRECLNNPIEARSSETLASVMMLSIYEVRTYQTQPGRH